MKVVSQAGFPQRVYIVEPTTHDCFPTIDRSWIPLPPLVVSFYTDSYLEPSRRLIESLNNHRIAHQVDRVTDLGNWIANTHHKPQFLLEKLRKHNRPLCWIDADGELLDTLSLHRSIPQGTDIAVHYRYGDPKALLSGTIYLIPTPKTFELLEAWRQLCRRESCWDQILLSKAIDQVGAQVHNLEVKYCSIFDGRDRPADAVILHHQHSRIMRASSPASERYMFKSNPRL